MSNQGGVYTWSKTAANNATADSTVNYAEGQAPSSLNDSARAAMTSVAKWRDDISGAIVTTGTAQNYIVASNQAFDTAADFHGQVIAFTPHATNTGSPVTLTVDGIANVPVRSAPGTELPVGFLVRGTPYVGVYNNTDGAIYLQGVAGPVPYVMPIGAGMDYWGATAPNSSFAFPTGQAISRTTYAALFAITGTTYGVGDGSTTFNLPDKRGRTSVAADASAGRISTTSMTSVAPGGTGGAETETLTAAQIPTINAAGSGWTVSGFTNSGLSPVSSSSQPTAFSATPGSQVFEALPNGATVATQVFTASGTTSSTNTGGQAHVNVQPSIVCNYIMRII